MALIKFKVPPTGKWGSGKQVDEISGQFGGWALTKNKAGYDLVKENYTAGQPNMGVYVGDDTDPDTQAIKDAFTYGDEDALQEYFTLNGGI